MSKSWVVSGGRWWVTMVLSAGLLACATTSEQTVSIRPAKPVVRAAVAQGPATSASTAVPAPATKLPYSEAVAARFPDPAIALPTPAFEPGRTDFTSNEELRAMMHGLVRSGSADRATVKLLPLGRSQSDQPIEGLLFTKLPDTDPAAIVKSGRITVMLMGQQHGDEPAGAEALLVIAQELAGGKLEPLLDRINVVMLARANPDGARDGSRVTASGIDMNRDHLLLKTPEAQALARLAREFKPAVVIDSHEYSVVGRYLRKFDAVQKFDALVQYAMTANEPPFITKAAEEWFRKPLLAGFNEQGISNEWYYTTSFTEDGDKKVSMGGVQPDLARNVYGLRNAVSFLIETRGVGLGRLHLKRRVFTHLTAIRSLLISAAERAADLAKVKTFVEQEVSSQACQGETVVEAAATTGQNQLQMIDPLTGADKSIDVVWDSSLDLRPVKTRVRPCGYWLSDSQTDAVLKLRGLGVTVMQLLELGDMRAETYRELSRETMRRPDVRGTVADIDDMVKVQVQTVPSLIDVKAGSYYVPLDQPLANLVIAAMEPDTQSSYFANGVITNLDAQARVMWRPSTKMAALP